MTTATETTPLTSAKHAAAVTALTAWINAAALEVAEYYKCVSDEAKATWKAGLSERMEPLQKAALTAHADLGVENDIVADLSESNAFRLLEVFDGTHTTRGIFGMVVSYARHANSLHHGLQRRGLVMHGSNTHKGAFCSFNSGR